MRTVTIGIGCGSRKVKGSIGIDGIHQPGVDVVCDFEHSIPLKTDSVDTLYASHVLEHIQNLVQLMEEIYRVCKPGSLGYITVPHFISSRALSDPTHVRLIIEDTFWHFQDPTSYGIRTNFKIQEIHFKYRTVFRILPRFLKNVLRKYLWNIAAETIVTLQTLDSRHKPPLN